MPVHSFSEVFLGYKRRASHKTCLHIYGKCIRYANAVGGRITVGVRVRVHYCVTNLHVMLNFDVC